MNDGKNYMKRLDVSATFFHNCSQTSIGKVGLDYLQKRGAYKGDVEKI